MAKLTVNNQPIEYRMDPTTPLLWALRCGSNLTGTKFGCGTGQCGACTVDVDGLARRACQVPIGSIEGSFVTTVEGLSRDRTHPLQLALLAGNVSQCGFCIPGIVMAGAALLKRNRNPSDAEIGEALTNLCRCGIYPRLADAVKRAARIQNGDETVTGGGLPGTDQAHAAREVPALTSPRPRL